MCEFEEKCHFRVNSQSRTCWCIFLFNIGRDNKEMFFADESCPAKVLDDFKCIMIISLLFKLLI